MKLIERRRKHKPALPDNYMMYLNADQMDTYIHLKKFGWRMYFIRRPALRKHTIAMINNTGTRIGVLKQSGFFSLNQLSIKLRDLDKH